MVSFSSMAHHARITAWTHFQGPRFFPLCDYLGRQFHFAQPEREKNRESLLENCYNFCKEVAPCRFLSLVGTELCRLKIHVLSPSPKCDGIWKLPLGRYFGIDEVLRAELS
jgi:hypothetical protein